MDAIEDQLIRADLIVTSGGVSVGTYDVVKEVLAKLGTVRFTKVAMQPGMPQGFGVIGPDETPIFTLPGNPVSSLRLVRGLRPTGHPAQARRTVTRWGCRSSRRVYVEVLVAGGQAAVRPGVA